MNVRKIIFLTTMAGLTMKSVANSLASYCQSILIAVISLNRFFGTKLCRLFLRSLR